MGKKPCVTLKYHSLCGDAPAGALGRRDTSHYVTLRCEDARQDAEVRIAQGLDLIVYFFTVERWAIMLFNFISIFYLLSPYFSLLCFFFSTFTLLCSATQHKLVVLRGPTRTSFLVHLRSTKTINRYGDNSLSSVLPPIHTFTMLLRVHFIWRQYTV